MAVFKNIPWQRFIKFAITGGTALAIDIAIYVVLTRFGHMPYFISRAISLSIAVVWNFTVNRHWTFEAGTGKVSQQAPKFLTVIIATSLINLGLMRIGVSYLHLNDLLVLIGNSVLIVLINFSAHYFWSYKKTE